MDTHGCYRAAAGMTRTHNIILRGLNAIIQQGPHVAISTDRDYDPQISNDFLRYVGCWRKMASHHHWVEESFFFPELERYCSQPGRMSGAQHEHELSEESMERPAAYMATTGPEVFRWGGQGGMRRLQDALCEPRVQHLYVEIDVILALKDLDSELVHSLWAQVSAYCATIGPQTDVVSSNMFSEKAKRQRLTHWIDRYLPMRTRDCRCDLPRRESFKQTALVLALC